ncbi:MAG: alpha/beta hydrolase [Candidatus Obscuribacterales bacterium]|nr:alpha/beta hydrolase [Candidatus Obscuribacterales bacterium]
MSSFTTSDGIKINFKDWGAGIPVIFSHGWPLSSDAFEDQMFYLADRGFRCIAHDRRGHGNSDQSWTGNDMDTYLSDLRQLVDHLGITQAVHVGHSTGGGEAVRYAARRPDRVSKLILIGAVPPIMVQTTSNPDGLAMQVFDDIRKNLLKDRSQFFKDLSLPFYGFNRDGAEVSQGLRDSFWLQGMNCSFKSAFACVKAFSETDFTDDLKAIEAPTLLLHGDDDQIVPIADSAKLSVKLIKNSRLTIVEGGPHGMCSTRKNEINQLIFDFLNERVTLEDKSMVSTAAR